MPANCGSTLVIVGLFPAWALKTNVVTGGGVGVTMAFPFTLLCVLAILEKKTCPRLLEDIRINPMKIRIVGTILDMGGQGAKLFICRIFDESSS